jgi:hypothetical protein
MRILLPLSLFLVAIQFVCADDFKTVNGREYKNATVSRVEPDGITIKFKGGIVKLPFSELSKEVQEQFHYDPEKAAAVYASQLSAIEQARRREEIETARQQRQRERQQSASANSAANSAPSYEYVQGLIDRQMLLQQLERNLLARIGTIQRRQTEARHAWIDGRSQTGTDPSEGDLPLLESQLNSVRDEESRVASELQNVRGHQ